MSSLRVVTAGLDLMAEALRDQRADVTALDWRPPAGGDPEDVAVLAATYGDDRVGEANARALARLQEARPMIVGAGAAGELIPGLEGRTVLHAGPPVEWDLMCHPQSNAICGAVMLEGWAATREEADRLIARGEVRLASAHSLDAAGAMTGVISPSMAVWAARDEVGGGVGYSPFNDGPGEAFWLGVGSPEAIRRQRTLADAIAPGFAAALRAEGPIDGFALAAQGLAMGDDCHMRHQATTMLLLRQTLPAIAERAPRSVLPTARLLATNGHFALTVTIACARAALAGIAGDARFEPDRLHQPQRHRHGGAARRPAGPLVHEPRRPPVGDALYHPGMSDGGRGARHRRLGARGVLRPRGRSQRGQPRRSPPSSAAAWPRRSSAPGRWPTSASARASASASRPSTGRARRSASTPARCVDLGATPLINTGILHRATAARSGRGSPACRSSRSATPWRRWPSTWAAPREHRVGRARPTSASRARRWRGDGP